MAQLAVFIDSADFLSLNRYEISDSDSICLVLSIYGERNSEILNLHISNDRVAEVVEKLTSVLQGEPV